MATTFVFKKDRAVELPGTDAPVLAEVTQRPWRVSQGDRVLIADGAGLYTRFVGSGLVDFVEVVPVPRPLAWERFPNSDPGKLHFYRLRLSGWQYLPEIRSLGEVMYSLERVTNFSRPTLNVRHHARLSDVDVLAIEKGLIDQGRSLYFGLLQHMPEPQRTRLDLLCQLAQASSGREFDPASAAAPLLRSLRAAVGEPIRLASRLHTLRTKLEQKRPISAVSPAKNKEWRAERLLHLAARDDGMTLSLFDSLTEVSGTTEPGERRKWRPHHW